MSQRTLLIRVSDDQFATVPITERTQFLLVNAPILSVNPNYRYRSIVAADQVRNWAATPCTLLLGEIDPVTGELQP